MRESIHFYGLVPHFPAFSNDLALLTIFYTTLVIPPTQLDVNFIEEQYATLDGP